MIEWLLGGPWAPHAICLLYDPEMIGALAAGDLAIWAAYMILPFLLPRLVRTRAVPHGAVGLLCLFVFSCGVQHLLHTITLWVPMYRGLALWTAFTGLVSLATVAALLLAWHRMGGIGDGADP